MDIVEELRAHGKECFPASKAWLNKAADEIERLEADVQLYKAGSMMGNPHVNGQSGEQISDKSRRLLFR